MITKLGKKISNKLGNKLIKVPLRAQEGNKPKLGKSIHRKKLKARLDGTNDQVSTNCAQLPTAFTPLHQLTAMGAHNLSKITLRTPKKHWGSYIVSGRVGMIVAPRGAGKSTLVLALGISMGYEVNFLGSKPAKKRCVVILDGEMDLHTMQKRLREQSHALKVKTDDKHLKFVSPELFDGIMPSLSTEEGQREIDEVLGDEWDVLFIDNYSAFSENGREDGDSWMPWIKWMLAHKRAGRTVIVIHHAGKNGQQRGTSKHEDALDFSIALKPVPNAEHDGNLRFIFEWKKSRHLSSDKTRPFLVTYAKSSDGYEWTRGNVDDADEKKVALKKLLAEGVLPAEIAKKLDVAKSTISRWIKAMK